MRNFADRDGSEVSDALRVTLSGMQEEVFAVLDGAIFDDLPATLRSAGIGSRSLFLDHADKEIEAAGPWLVPLSNENARDFTIRLAAVRPCAVFWSCSAGEIVLWRHLRSINEVLVATSTQSNNLTNVSSTEKAAERYERLMFRHWDPDVMAQVMPALESDAFSALFGDCLSREPRIGIDHLLRQKTELYSIGATTKDRARCRNCN